MYERENMRKSLKNRPNNKETTKNTISLSTRGLTREAPNHTLKHDVIINIWWCNHDIYIHQMPRHWNIQSITGNKSLHAWGCYCININEILSLQRLKYTPTIPIWKWTTETYAANGWESIKIIIGRLLFNNYMW